MRMPPPWKSSSPAVAPRLLRIDFQRPGISGGAKKTARSEEWAVVLSAEDHSAGEFANELDRLFVVELLIQGQGPGFGHALFVELEVEDSFVLRFLGIPVYTHAGQGRGSRHLPAESGH